MHTMQSAFDAALNGVRNQQYRKARRQSGTCVYFVPVGSLTGARCGVGHMLTEETAKAAVMGGVTAILDGNYDGNWSTAAFKEELKGLPKPFLAACQYAHDAMAERGTGLEFETEMARIASEFNLTYTPPVVGPADC